MALRQVIPAGSAVHAEARNIKLMAIYARRGLPSLNTPAGAPTLALGTP